MSNSTDGSVNGKKLVRMRISRRPPNTALANVSIVPRRSVSVMPRSIASASTWWKIGVCVASIVSRRYTRPSDTTYTGGSCARIARICDGDVCVRMTVWSSM